MEAQEKLEILKELKDEVMDEVMKMLGKIYPYDNIPSGSKKVYIETCRDNVSLPMYSNKGDAGMDVRAAQDVIILPGETKVVPLGIKIAIPEGYEIQVRPRSGLSLNTPLRISNAPGTIDSGYRDEVGVIISNTSPRQYNKLSGKLEEINADGLCLPTYELTEKGNKPGIYLIHVGDRIAQIVLSKYEEIEFVKVEPGIVKTLGFNRGGGYGHSGTN